jgi:hypothetical protein
MLPTVGGLGQSFGKYPGEQERYALEQVGNTLGCHSCCSGKGPLDELKWVADHQPPTELVTRNLMDMPQVLLPHCKRCSEEQATIVRAITSCYDACFADGPVKKSKAQEAREKKEAKERQFEQDFEEELREDYNIVEIARFGDCLFGAVAHLHGGNQNLHATYRAAAVNVMRTNAELNFDQWFATQDEFNRYLDRMAQPYQWGGEFELVALAIRIDRPIIVHSRRYPGNQMRFSHEGVDGMAEPIHIYHEGGSHYQALEPR